MSKHTVGIHVGNIVNEETRKELQEFISHVFTAGAATKMTPKTIRFALNLFHGVNEVKNVTVQDCMFTLDKHGEINNTEIKHSGKQCNTLDGQEGSE